MGLDATLQPKAEINCNELSLMSSRSSVRTGARCRHVFPLFPYTPTLKLRHGSMNRHMAASSHEPKTNLPKADDAEIAAVSPFLLKLSQILQATNRLSVAARGRGALQPSSV